MNASSTHDTSADSKHDKPIAPPETRSEIYIRRTILAAFWIVVLFLGIPHWLWTTSVYRAQLDIAGASKWIEGQACSFRYPIHIAISGEQSEPFGRLLSNILQSQQGLYIFHVHGNANRDADLTIELISNSAKPIAKLRGWGSHLVVDCQTMTEECAQSAAQIIETTFLEDEARIMHVLRDSPFVHITSEQHNNVEMDRISNRVFKYASSYHLTFSLITAKSSPSSWNIEQALQKYINPLLAELSSVSNFTVDTQIQLFSTSMAHPHYDEGWILGQEDLSTFINAAEWPLNPSIDSGPTINFVLYIPSDEKSPLLVAGSSTNSWVVPQWGGVKILNIKSESLTEADLEETMYAFADQLTSLVGLPQQPQSLHLRIQALTRQRIASLIASTSSTLGALIRLTEKLEQIAIPQTVAQAVSSSIADLEQACHRLEAGHLQQALQHARLADEAVEKAFFEPSMVGQVYFPDEHKVAVYVPLLGPMAVPLLLATIKEIRQFRNKVKVQ